MFCVLSPFAFYLWSFDLVSRWFYTCGLHLSPVALHLFGMWDPMCFLLILSMFFSVLGLSPTSLCHLGLLLVCLPVLAGVYNVCSSRQHHDWIWIWGGRRSERRSELVYAFCTFCDSNACSMMFLIPSEFLLMCEGCIQCPRQGASYIRIGRSWSPRAEDFCGGWGKSSSDVDKKTRAKTTTSSWDPDMFRSTKSSVPSLSKPPLSELPKSVQAQQKLQSSKTGKLISAIRERASTRAWH